MNDYYCFKGENAKTTLTTKYLIIYRIKYELWKHKLTITTHFAL